MDRIILLTGVVVIAWVMAIVGAAALGLQQTGSLVFSLEYCIPSVATWIPIAFILRTGSRLHAIAWGAASCAIGAFWFVPLWPLLMLVGFFGLFGFLPYGAGGSAVALAVGMFTGYLMHLWCGQSKVWWLVRKSDVTPTENAARQFRVNVAAA